MPWVGVLIARWLGGWVGEPAGRDAPIGNWGSGREGNAGAKKAPGPQAPDTVNNPGAAAEGAERTSALSPGADARIMVSSGWLGVLLAGRSRRTESGRCVSLCPVGPRVEPSPAEMAMKEMLLEQTQQKTGTTRPTQRAKACL